MKRVRRREGDILRIDLGDGRHVYAQVAREPVIVFFDATYADDLPLECVARLPVLFRLWVMNHAITRGRWTVIGHHALAAENAAEPFFFKQDAISGGLSLYHSSFADTNYERPASLADCQGLECAAVWEPGHVEDRLRDHSSGVPNRWAESLQIDTTRLQ